jgi:hypothetical protein
MWVVLWYRLRYKEVCGLEKALGLEFYGTELPVDFPIEALGKMSILAVAKPMNCLSGLRNGERFVCFDYTLGRQILNFGPAMGGRRLNFGTMLTIPNGPVSRLPERVRPMVRYQDSRWTVIATTTRQGAIRAKRMVQMWDEIYALPGTVASAEIEAEAASREVVIRPRHQDS